MITISGYKIEEKIYEDIKTVVYRAQREQDNKAVIIKMLNSEYPTPKEIYRFMCEYEIAKSLNIEGIAKYYSFEKSEATVFLIIEYFGSSSLKEAIVSQEIDLNSFLQIAIQISQALEKIHEKNIIHKDIRPQNILFDSQTLQIKITDFSIATKLFTENQNISSPNLLEGTLAYMSPEQTGRMNRAIDYRSDFYSLGITFFEMLTGQLPFPSTDPMELVHCHIAKKPVPPHQLKSDIPETISSIVMKLLAKTAEDRYQTAYGLKADLQICLTQLQATGKIGNFLPGQQDITAKFQIPQKLYGREQEITTLMAAFDRVSQGAAEMMLVSGYSGIGKTALINEIHKPIVRQRGYFISGKFDQYKRNIPYVSLIQAFQDLIRQLLTESQEQIEAWKQKLLDAFGLNGQVIIDVIPETELIVGKQLPIAELGATESQNRFNLVFQKFINVFTKKEHPLVLFLDDLQWSDSASLKLLQLIMTSLDSQYLLLIGAYRDNEVNPAHLLMLTLDEIQKTGVSINHITLQALDIDRVSELISDTLHSEEKMVKPLAELLLNKTAGNPFFLTQMLISLYQEKLVEFNFSASCWQWKIEQIEAMRITDNVVELMICKIQKLSHNTQKVLKLAACIGSQFDLDILSAVNDKTLSATAFELWEVLQEGLIIPLSDAYKIVSFDEQISPEALTDGDLRVSYKFSHDRVQQAAYALISENDKKAIHLKIGQLMQKNIGEAKQEDKIFDIINQMNFAVELITDPKEKYALAKLNSIAGKKAKASAAYETALRCFILGLEVLPGNIWQEHYDLTFTLYKECSECEYLCGNFKQAEACLTFLLNQAKSPLEKAEVYNLTIILYAFQNKAFEAIKIGMEALNGLGLYMPTKKSQLSNAIKAELQELKLNMGDKKIQDLMNLPTMKDLDKQATIKLMFSLFLPTYQINKTLLAFNALKMVNLSLKYGLANESPDAFCNYALVAGSVFGDYETAHHFGEFALKINEKINNFKLNSKMYFWYGLTIIHWRKHLKLSIPVFRKGYECGLESGDLTHSILSCFWTVMAKFILGNNLPDLYEQADKYDSFIQKNAVFFDDYRLIKMLLLNLQGLTNDKHSLSNDSFDENEFISTSNKLDVRDVNLHFYHQFKLQIFWLFEEYAEALNMANSSANTVEAHKATFNEPEHYFYYSLTLTALYKGASENEQKNYWKLIKINQKKMKIWAENCSDNFSHKYLLIEAEIARISGKNQEAMDLYDRAIESARENEYTQNEAIANELAAKFYLAKGKNKIAKVYLMDARYGYLKWGATAKVKDLDEKYPHLLGGASAKAKTVNGDITISSTNSSTVSENINALDLITIVKASQVLAGEIVLGNLLSKLLKIVIENAGAQTICLILEKDGQLVIEATSAVEQEDVILWQSMPVEASQELPVSLLNYVARTKKNMVLGRATEEGDFSRDAYIVKAQPKSILCMPIINKSKLIGLLYLENNLTNDAFTSERLEVLKLLSSQVAISLENALLYNNLEAATENLRISKEKLEEYSRTLEQKVEERTLELKEKNFYLEQAMQELKQTQIQLIQTEKMSSLGQLVAGIAHEINNPINFIYGNLIHAREYLQDLLNMIQIYQEQYSNPTPKINAQAEAIDLEFLMADLPKLLSSMQIGAERIRQIVLSLRNFSRLDEADKKWVDIHEGIDSTLLILQHRLRFQPGTKEREAGQVGIQVIKEYGNLPNVECHAGQMNQVFMNILTNAIDGVQTVMINLAKNHLLPTICIHTEVLNTDRVTIRISDNGSGMTEEVRSKVFDPFFTTKPVGSGTGLGLSISYQIVVEKHGGQLKCISAVGEGTEFVIEIPVQQPSRQK